MSRQINLFNPLFLKQKKYFSALAMLQGLGMLLVGLGVFYGYALYQRTSLQKQAADVERAYAAASARLTSVSADLAPDKIDAQLDQDLKAAEQALAARRGAFGELHDGVAESGAGYSSFLRALARQTVEGLWLTGVNIDSGGRSLTLSGRTIQPDLLPEYMRRLGREEILRGRPFEKLEIARREPAELASGRASVPFVEFALLSTTQSRQGPVVSAPEQPAREKAK